MNHLKERVAYLKGLVEGMQVGELTREDQLLKEIIDVMNDMALAIEELASVQEQQREQIIGIDDDLSDIENMIFDCKDIHECEGEDNEYFNRGFGIGSYRYEISNFEYDGQLGKEREHEIYMVECPYCFEVIEVDKEECADREESTIECPKCREIIDIEWMDD